MGSFGRDRVEQSKNLEREGWGTGFKDAESKDKAKYLVKKGLKWPTAKDIAKVK